MQAKITRSHTGDLTRHTTQRIRAAFDFAVKLLLLVSELVKGGRCLVQLRADRGNVAHIQTAGGGAVKALPAREHHVDRIGDVPQRCSHLVIQFYGRHNACHEKSPLTLDLCHLGFFLFRLFHSRGDDERLVFLVEREEIRRQNMQLVQSIQSKAGLRILCLDQFFAVSTSSARVVKPEICCTLTASSVYSPASSSISLSSSSALITP